MAAHNPPDAVFAVVRRNGASVSLANAFAKPVRPERDIGLMEASIARLDDYWGRLTTVYGSEGIEAKAICTVPDVALKNLHSSRGPWPS